MTLVMEQVILAVIIGTLLAIVYSLRVLVAMEKRIARIDLHIEALTEKVLSEELKIEKVEDMIAKEEKAIEKKLSRRRKKR